MWGLWKISPASCYDADFGGVYDEHVLICEGTYDECVTIWREEFLDPFYTYLENKETGEVFTYEEIPM